MNHFYDLEKNFFYLTHMWQSAEICQVNVDDHVQLCLAIFRPEKRRQSGVVLIAPGRGEIMTKYGEVIHELLNFGVAVAVYDHRGQGFSSALLPDKRVGYVNSFDDYANDLRVITRFLRNKKRFKAINVVAHSMGAAITLDFISKNPTCHSINKALLVSPMLKLPLNPFSMNLIRFLSRFTQFRWMLQVLKASVPGKGRNKKTIFSGNPYSHDSYRFTYFRAAYPLTESLSTPGVSFRWLSEALEVTKRLCAKPEQVDIPVSVVASGADIIVDNAPLEEFCSKLHQANNLSPSRPLVVEGAYHELHLEADEFRDIFVGYLHHWLLSEKAMQKEKKNDSTNEDDNDTADTGVDNESSHEPKGIYKYYPMKFVFQFKDFIRRLSQLS